MRNVKGQFTKGSVPWMKGRTASLATRLKMSTVRTGKQRGVDNPFYGRKHTDESKQKMSVKLKGRSIWCASTKGVVRAWNKGLKGVIKYSEATRLKMSEAQKRIGNRPPIKRGAASHLWKGGITPVNLQIRHSPEYKQWREAVFKRDDYRCLDCGERGGALNADHIYPFSLFPRLRLVLENGRTLCLDCHRNTSTFAGRIKQLQYA